MPTAREPNGSVRLPGAVGGSLSGFDVWHPGMTHNGSGTPWGCLGDELSAVVPAST
jgi:hypothetical protein